VGKETVGMYILGISCYYHDSAAVLLKDGIIVAASDEERFSRMKHDSSFPEEAISYCLQKGGISASDLTYVAFYEKPFLKFERILLSSFKFAPKTRSFFSSSMKEWFFDKLWIKSHILAKLNIDENKLLFSEHHLSHMASAFFCSPYNEAALLSIDGVGEWTTTSWGIGKDTAIEIKEEIRYPHSLGLFYSAFTVFCGFEANEGEYKLMGLAPYGKPRYTDKVSKLLDVKKDGSFSLNLEYFSYQYDVRGIYTDKFTELFGVRNKKPDEVSEYYADVASSVQLVTENILVAIAKNIQRSTKMKYLCYAGGVALNSKANWRIRKESGFDGVYIQPSAGDSGGALGAALWVYHTLLKNKRNPALVAAYFGLSQTDQQIENFLKKQKIKYRKIVNSTTLADEISDLIANGKVIGVIQDEAEWGPRALGHRSILADPRSKAMKDTVNKKIKFREAFRPFAPSTLLEKADEYFSVEKPQNELPFRFMLYVVPVKKEKRKVLQAITHEDGTARPQFVEKKSSPFYHKLITKFGEKTGVYVLLNTSFNLKGEPIVNTVEHAYSTFLRSGIDTLVLGKYVINK
jgi:carbamoyltransferase